MKNKGLNNAKVGLFVLAGILFLVVTLYMIGKNRNLLGATFTIRAEVANVNGLVPGNNVRFKGIDVGTVKSIAIANDTAIYVTMVIDQKMKPFIKKNVIASIGTDGLMGNKLININSQPGPAGLVEEGDTISSLQPVETDEMLRTLNTTNANIERITQNLYEITVKLNRNNSLWTLLSDTVITMDFKHAMALMENAAANTSELTRSGKELVRKLEQGEGVVPALFTDTTLTYQLTQSLEEIQLASQQASEMIAELKKGAEHMKAGGGSVGLVLTDTLFRETLLRSALNIEQGTEGFNENMEALKTNFLFRRYFKKLEKKKNQTASAKEE